MKKTKSFNITSNPLFSAILSLAIMLAPFELLAQDQKPIWKCNGPFKRITVNSPEPVAARGKGLSKFEAKRDAIVWAIVHKAWEQYDCDFCPRGGVCSKKLRLDDFGLKGEMVGEESADFQGDCRKTRNGGGYECEGTVKFKTFSEAPDPWTEVGCADCTYENSIGEAAASATISNSDTSVQQQYSTGPATLEEFNSSPGEKVDSEASPEEKIKCGAYGTERKIKHDPNFRGSGIGQDLIQAQYYALMDIIERQAEQKLEKNFLCDRSACTESAQCDQYWEDEFFGGLEFIGECKYIQNRIPVFECEGTAKLATGEDIPTVRPVCGSC